MSSPESLSGGGVQFKCMTVLILKDSSGCFCGCLPETTAADELVILVA